MNKTLKTVQFQTKSQKFSTKIHKHLQSLVIYIVDCRSFVLVIIII